MKNAIFIKALALAALSATAQTGYAASTLTYGSTPSAATATIDAASGPFNFTINYDGFGGDTPSVIAGLTSSIAFGFTGTSNAGKTYNFTYNLSNTSSGPITASRVSLFGFDTNPNISSASSTGLFNFAGTGNVPNVGNVEICFKTQNNGNCAGGGGGGVALGSSASGTFALNFGSAPNAGTIALNNFAVRYQSIAGAGQVSSAVGRPTTPMMAVPEPAAWAMMIAGFGLVGSSMRRRRTNFVTA